MNMKKILAAASASVLAVSAMSVMAFAGEVEIGYQEEWYDANEYKGDKFADFFDGVDVAEVESVTFKFEDPDDETSQFAIGVQLVDSDNNGSFGDNWAQNNSDGANWLTLTGATADKEQDADGFFVSGTTVTLPMTNVLVGDAASCIKFVVNKSENATVSWTVNKKGAEAPVESTPEESTPEESTPADDDTTKPAVPTGVEGVAAVLGVAVVAAGAMVVAKKRK